MGIQHTGYPTQGFYRAAALGYGIMPEAAQQKLDILDFAQRHGNASQQGAACEAYSISRRTLQQRFVDYYEDLLFAALVAPTKKWQPKTATPKWRNG